MLLAYAFQIASNVFILFKIFVLMNVNLCFSLCVCVCVCFFYFAQEVVSCPENIHRVFSVGSYYFFKVLHLSFRS